METINIVFSSDNNYAQFMGVAICSLFENKTCTNQIDIYVIDGGISEKNKIKLKFLENTYDFKINFIKIDTSLFKDFYISQHITQAAYYRIMISKLLPNLKKILYLDCDIIIIGDIFELYNINTDNYFFAAVAEPVIDRQIELKMPQKSKYFNSGVMLVNLEKWKQHNTSEKVLNFIKNNFEKLKMWDQDALNSTMWDKWFEIPFKYNYTTLLHSKFPIAHEGLESNILIIHYTDYFKPWNYFSEYPLNKKYFYYLKKTPWKNIKYTNKSFKNMLIKYSKLIFPIKFINLIKYIIKKFIINQRNTI